MGSRSGLPWGLIGLGIMGSCPSTNISIDKIRIKIFRIMSTDYVRISRLNVKYQMYPISKCTYFQEDL